MFITIPGSTGEIEKLSVTVLDCKLLEDFLTFLSDNCHANAFCSLDVLQSSSDLFGVQRPFSGIDHDSPKAVDNLNKA